jgi:hypothetical protein
MCPTCGLDLTHAPLMDRERHAEECEAVLTQLDDEDNERDDGDGDDELDDDLDDKLFMLVDQIDACRRKRVADAETSKEKEKEDVDVEFKVERRAILSTEDIHDWLKRIGMERYFESLYVKEDLLDVSVARECSKEDLMSVGVSEADALVLAFCGGEPPDAFIRDEPPRRPRTVSKPKITAPKTRSRTALELAKATANSNSEQLWSIAKGVANRGRGESLPSIDRFRSAA